MDAGKQKQPYTGEGREILTLGFDKLVKFHISVQQYSAPQGGFVPIERWVNAVAFKNAGTGFVTVMGDPLQPGETKSIGGNNFEVWDEKHCTFNFTNPNAVPGVVNLLIVTQKFYVEITRASSV
jgi:hypothetical protein